MKSHKNGDDGAMQKKTLSAKGIQNLYILYDQHMWCVFICGQKNEKEHKKIKSYV